MRNVAMDSLIELIGDIKNQKQAGTPDTRLASAQDYQRKAQFLLDFVEAENSTGFHAPQEAARVLFTSLEYSRKGQLALRGPAGAGQKSAAASADAPPKPKTP